jgi:hypothetical protein
MSIRVVFVRLGRARRVPQLLGFTEAHRSGDVRRHFTIRSDQIRFSASSTMKTNQKIYDHIHHYRGASTYDHRSVKTGHPVRSAIHKH